jgi:hypothetical protein
LGAAEKPERFRSDAGAAADWGGVVDAERWLGLNRFIDSLVIPERMHHRLLDVQTQDRSRTLLTTVADRLTRHDLDRDPRRSRTTGINDGMI